MGADDRAGSTGRGPSQPGAATRDDPALTLPLEASLHAPREARHAVAAWARARGLGAALVHDVVLVVSELVTNAVTHAGSLSSFAVTVTPAGAARVEVGDDDPAPPRPSTSRAVGGVGLLVVSRLSHAWGWSPSAGGGKVVWAELRPVPAT